MLLRPFYLQNLKNQENKDGNIHKSEAQQIRWSDNQTNIEQIVI